MIRNKLIHSILMLFPFVLFLSACAGAPAQPTAAQTPAATIAAVELATATPVPTPVFTATLAPSATPNLDPDYWLHRQNPVGWLGWAPDGRTLVVSSSSGVYLYDLQGDMSPHMLTGDALYGPAALDAQGKRLIVANRVWDVATGKLLYQIPSKNPSSVAFSPDGNTLAIGEENSVTLWDASSGKLKKSIGAGVGGVQIYRGLAFSADGKSLYIAFDDQQVRQADIDSGRLTDLFSLPKDGCCVFISPGAQTLLVSRPGGGSGTKELWDLEKGVLLKSLGNCDNDTTLEVFSQDGSHFVIGPCRGAQLWDTRSGKMLHLIANPAVPDFNPDWRSAAFSPDGSQIALGNDLGQIFLWDTTTYEQLKMWTLPLPATPLASAFSAAFSHP